MERGSLNLHYLPTREHKMKNKHYWQTYAAMHSCIHSGKAIEQMIEIDKKNQLHKKKKGLQINKQTNTR